MIITGREIAAGRALLAMDQPTLAKAAGLHRNAISYWECRDTIPKVEPYAVQRIRKAMADAGVKFSSDPPGAWVMPCAGHNSEMPTVRGAQLSEQYAREAAQ